MVEHWWLLLLLGLAVGTLGTLIGAGGGFILVPVLIILLPNADPEHITAISLAVVCCNALSGSVAYLKMGRVDLKSAGWFSLATFPGAILGAFCSGLIPRHLFNIAFGMLLMVAAIYLMWKPATAIDPSKEPLPSDTRREITDKYGVDHVYHFSMPLGISLSVGVGFLSSLLGIGGGIIHVPILNRTLNFPVHVATATSQVILGFMAFTGSVVHFAKGDLAGYFEWIALLGVGATVGAQIGARLSNRLEGLGIIRALAVALGIVGARILWSSVIR